MRFGRWFRRYSLRAVALVALAAPILAACAGDDDDDEGGASAASSCPQGTLAGRTSPVEITFWHSMNAANEQTLQRLTDEFNASQDEVRVELVYQGTYTESRNKYLTALRGGELPDLIQLEDTSTQLMIDSGTTLTIQECVDAEGYDLSDYLERVVAYYTVEGTLASMPFNVSNPVLVYNKTAFQEAGLDPAFNSA
ncbi:MAG TPA: extracellular solute-binding protein, partial [Dehalococcoidia bacterium]|nr:extracellular solute-binding protein [Dehalococcoidia bacterium]